MAALILEAASPSVPDLGARLHRDQPVRSLAAQARLEAFLRHTLLPREG